MSQNPLTLPTTGTLSGLSLVEGINAALDTLNTLSSAAAAPASPEAGQLWHDTTTNTMWLRDQANTTWMAGASVDETDKKLVSVGTPLTGLILSGGGTSTLGIAPGNVLADSLDMQIVLRSAYSKTFTGFAIGSGNGGLDSGTVANSTWYHVYAILDPATGVSDVLMSLSATSPSLPSGFTRKEKIGAVQIDAAGVILPFTQNGNEFTYATGVMDIAGSGFTSNPGVYSTLTVPSGLKVTAKFRAAIVNGASSVVGALFQSPDEAANNAQFSSGSGCNLDLLAPQANAGIDGLQAGDFAVRTNTSAEIRVTGSITTSSAVISIYTYGFVYPRGPQ